jgi:HK97 gp10 family phage protein
VIGGKWSGVDGAAEALVAIASECARDEVVAQAMLQVSRPIAAEMGAALYSRVRRVTGETGASIEAAQVEKGDRPGITVVEIGPRKGSDAGWKVKFWELGTSKLPARPFMRPVWDEHQATFSTAVTAALGKAYQTLASRFTRRQARAS